MELNLPLLATEMHHAVYTSPAHESLASIDLPPGTARGGLRWAPRPRKLELTVAEIRESMMPDGPRCPACRGSKIVRNGKRRGIQRYRCSMCLRCFTDLTGTLLEGIHHRDKFLEFCLCMIRGCSVREAAHEVGISKNTSFEWRHRIISRLAQFDSERKLGGIVEVSQWSVAISGQSEMAYPFKLSDTRFMSGGLYKEAYDSASEWRRAYLLFGIDRAGRARTGLFDPTTDSSFSAAIDKMVDQPSHICVCKEPGMWPWVSEYPKRTRWIRFMLKRRGEHSYDASHPLYHSMNARSVQLRFREWMRRFCGVASHYLLRYASWYWRVFGFSYMNQQYAAKALFFHALQADAAKRLGSVAS